MDYALQELAFGRFDSCDSEELSSFATIDLAPHNYHRVHSPVGGVIRKIRYIPGELWPVNEPFVRFMPRLFNRNERLSFEIRLPNGGVVHAVMVGALNVGNLAPISKAFIQPEKDVEIEIKSGDELGTFMLGSTVVLVLDSSATDQFDLPQLTKTSSNGRRFAKLNKGETHQC